jgi:ATP-binding cassette subfamily A (ABC1) protein 5
VLSFFLLIMYVPPVYRTSYRIVAEKENKVKESMRMMGLRDTAYWLSWFSYYTLLNTTISFFTYLILF